MDLVIVSGIHGQTCQRHTVVGADCGESAGLIQRSARQAVFDPAKGRGFGLPTDVGGLVVALR